MLVDYLIKHFQENFKEYFLLQHDLKRKRLINKNQLFLILLEK